MLKGWPLLLLLGSCGGQPAIDPGGIVSNNPCIDSILAEIAAPGQIAAVSVYSHDADSASAPAGWAKALPALGTNAEDIIAARPKLVLTGDLASSGTNAALKKAGIPIVAVGVGTSVEEDKSQIRQIAKAINRAAAGEALIGRIDESFSQTAHAGPAISAVIWQNGGFVAGEGTLQDELLTRHGFRNASSTYGLKSWGVLPLETLIRNPPDIVFMPVKGGGDDERALKARTQLLRHLGGNTQIVDFPDRLLFCGGPTIIKVSEILSEARETFHAAARKDGA
jgi:iron complex transport system substrate-binding protein